MCRFLSVLSCLRLLLFCDRWFCVVSVLCTSSVIGGAVNGCYVFFFFKQKTAYEMRISDWSSDVCSSDLSPDRLREALRSNKVKYAFYKQPPGSTPATATIMQKTLTDTPALLPGDQAGAATAGQDAAHPRKLFIRTFGCQMNERSEEHTSELQSLMRNSYAVFCFTKKT